jgi:type II secretory pathway component PulJ
MDEPPTHAHLMITNHPSRLPEFASDAGYTLIELLIASAMAVIVLGATVVLLGTSQRVQARDTEWALVMQEGRAGLGLMAREIRQASTVEEAEAKGDSIVFLATVGATAMKIKYDCNVAQPGTTYTQCVRYQAEQGKSLPSTGLPVARDVTNGTKVFEYFNGTTATTVKPDVVTLTLELPSAGTLKQINKGGRKSVVVLENAAFMRNLLPEG